MRSAFVVRDSAGVTVATSSTPRWASAPEEAWTISPTPLLDLSTASSGPEHEFYRVADIVRLSDGRIVVANTGSFELRIYAPDGTHLAAGTQ